MTPANYSFTIYQGANWGPVVIQCKDTNGAAVNIEGWTANAVAKSKCGGIIFDLAPTISNGANGEISFEKTAAETKNAPCGFKDWDLMLTRPNGYVIGPLVAGRVAIVPTQTQVV